MSKATLPFLHKNSRSSRISVQEIREVFAEEVCRGLRFNGVSKEEYLATVMPS